ncbi:AraC family transcriptional regulator [Ruminococcus sp. OA3]|uniref:helix-turn-helix transcriptional regulator n=1 Tax=Ruminococcus sp. OA3 TaxID=2914164 RepID=UPI001F05D974|nr:AraC family transcriptional regulator [Ruminococcus sp. OA3]MCH1981731.1 AraC family transcriptional regulator [Ruminococcus sp. OA3]
MPTYKLQPIAKEAGIIEKKGIYFHDPSDFARMHLFYPFFGAVYTCVPPYRVSRPNDYPQFYLILYVLEGELHVQYDGRHQTARTDDVVFFDCSRPHQYWAEKQVTFQWLHFEGGLTPLYCDLLSQDGVCHSGKSEISLLLGDILNHIKNKEISEHRLSSYIYDILTRLTVQNPSRESSSIRSAVRYMSQYYRKAPSIEEIANHVSLNPQYFSRLFKRQMGSSPHSYLLSLQLQNAKTLLIESTLNIQQISEECGFTSSTHFIRAFKSKNLVTPMVFRKYYNVAGFEN